MRSSHQFFRARLPASRLSGTRVIFAGGRAQTSGSRARSYWDPPADPGFRATGEDVLRVSAIGSAASGHRCDRWRLDRAGSWAGRAPPWLALRLHCRRLAVELGSRRHVALCRLVTSVRSLAPSRQCGRSMDRRAGATADGRGDPELCRALGPFPPKAHTGLGFRLCPNRAVNALAGFSASISHRLLSLLRTSS